MLQPLDAYYTAEILNRLKTGIRVRVYKCECDAVHVRTYDIASSFRTESCFRCQRSLDPDNIIGDSHYPDLYSEVRFVSDGITDSGKDYVKALYMTECIYCHENRYLPIRGSKIEYKACPCQLKAPIQQANEDIEFKALLSYPLVQALKNYCFDNNTTRDSVLLEGLTSLLIDKGYLTT